MLCHTVMILSFWTDMPGQTVQTQIRLLLEEQSDQGLHCLPANSADPDHCSWRSSLIWVCTVCHSVCIVWTHYSMVEPHSSNFRVITTNFLGVGIFRKFTVFSKQSGHYTSLLNIVIRGWFSGCTVLAWLTPQLAKNAFKSQGKSLNLRYTNLVNHWGTFLNISIFTMIFFLYLQRSQEGDLEEGLYRPGLQHSGRGGWGGDLRLLYPGRWSSRPERRDPERGPDTLGKNPKNLGTRKICGSHPKIRRRWLYHRIMRPRDAERMANSVDPDQTAPLGAVWSGFTLFAHSCLSENLGTIW